MRHSADVRSRSNTMKNMDCRHSRLLNLIESIMGQTKVADSKHIEANAYVEGGHLSIAADPVVKYMKSEDLKN